MPTVFSHPAPMLALAAIMGGRVSSRMLLFGVLCAVLPDADVIGFRFGISYADAFGHRGFSHSLAFALLMGCVGFGTAPLLLRGSRLMGFFHRLSGRFKPYPAGRHDQRRAGRSGVLAL